MAAALPQAANHKAFQIALPKPIQAAEPNQTDNVIKPNQTLSPEKTSSVNQSESKTCLTHQSESKTCSAHQSESKTCSAHQSESKTCSAHQSESTYSGSFVYLNSNNEP